MASHRLPLRASVALDTVIEADDGGNPVPAIKRQRRASRARPNLAESISVRRGSAVGPIATEINTPKAFSFAGLRSPFSPARSAGLDDLYAGLASPSMNEPLEVDIVLAGPGSMSIQRRPSRRSTHTRRQPVQVEDDRYLPALVIPETNEWPCAKKSHSAKMATPLRTPISPAALSLLPVEHSDPNAPPSLIESVSSDHREPIESPDTPSSQLLSDGAEWEGVVHLPPEALAILDSLPSNSLPSSSQPTLAPLQIPQNGEMREMQSASTSSPPPLSPNSEQAFQSLNKLDIPSPDEFFGTLKSAVRTTWNAPNTSIAEKFYNIPWIPDEPLPQPPPKMGPEPVQDELEPEADPEPEPVEESAAFFRMDQWLNQQYDLLETAREVAESPVETKDPLPESPKPEPIKESDSSTKPIKPVRESTADPTIYRAFQTNHPLDAGADSFVQREHRLYALRTARKVVPTQYRSQLVADLAVNLRKPKHLETPEQRHLHQKAQEQKAAEIITATSWNVSANRFLNAGKLFISPVQRRLAAAPLPTSTAAVRVLDLGGLPVADWAWQCASEFPNAKVYTVLNKTSTSFDPAGVRGPKNHRQIYVDSLYDLPFPDGYFDVISTRTLHTILKAKKHGGGLDEYDQCLRECLRCLKPGGYLEFSLFDAELSNAGPLTAAKCAEFSFKLRGQGYDPNPTRSWLGRISDAGFVDPKRSWTFMPAGSNSRATHDPAYGSARNVSAVTSLAGGWAWERWLLKLHMESGKAIDDPSLDILDAVLEESRQSGAGWRCLNGFARKPPMERKPPVFL